MRSNRIQPTAFEKVNECLYSIADTGNFYARVGITGKEIRWSLKTSDRQLAKRRLREVRKNLEKLDHSTSRVLLAADLDTFLASFRRTRANPLVGNLR